MKPTAAELTAFIIAFTIGASMVIGPLFTLLLISSNH